MVSDQDLNDYLLWWLMMSKLTGKIKRSKFLTFKFALFSSWSIIQIELQFRRENIKLPANNIFPLKLQIARRFVGQALQGMSLEKKRGMTIEDEIVKTLMFIDVILTEDGDLIAEVALQRHLDRPEKVDLEVKLASEWSLPEALQATLTWDSQTKSEPVGADGIALFPSIALDSLTAMSDDPTATGLDIVLAPA